ncbi:MAG TPA: hypothetical protein VG675_14715 [Bryobacteraceae bacterium]|nr:hypothetical protein [Bryobacteraceae bacterium]
MRWLLVLMALLALTASAADIAGTWKASIETPNGNFENTFVFKVDGSTFTGTVESRMGQAPITDGKIDGDNISFTVSRERDGQQFKMEYKGTVSGDQMKLNLQFGDRTVEMTAKKVS